MKKSFFLVGILPLFLSMFLFSCSKNEPDVPVPSPRDGVYEGDNLMVTIDGNEIVSINSVMVTSLKIPYTGGFIVGDNGINDNNGSAVYDTSVIFSGFPETDEEIVLKTVSTLSYFDGSLQLKTPDREIQYYEYSGKFTGDPDSPHSEQGLILEFKTLEYSE